jgi:hypothetical protein
MIYTSNGCIIRHRMLLRLVKYQQGFTKYIKNKLITELSKCATKFVTVHCYGQIFLKNKSLIEKQFMPKIFDIIDGKNVVFELKICNNVSNTLKTLSYCVTIKLQFNEITYYETYYTFRRNLSKIIENILGYKNLE